MVSVVKNSWLVPARDQESKRCNVLVGRTEGDRVVVSVTGKDGTGFMPVSEAIKLRTHLTQAIEAAAMGCDLPDAPDRS
ncbi:MAG TPA: hypothetical protein VJ914_40245 [Pseudonocardiaceae bacterium]|nr:hypothetical protein [Pseudonocardiaceae bacterium]